MPTIQQRRNEAVRLAKIQLGRNMKRLKRVMRTPSPKMTRANHLKNFARRQTPSPVSHPLTPARVWFKGFRLYLRK